VQNIEYLLFLNSIAHTDPEKALRHVPRERGSDPGNPETMSFNWTPGTGFSIPPSMNEKAPVSRIDWHDANAYCEWISQQTGHQWRLPRELEWEKAARGVDGRYFPWGNRADPSWACMRESHEGSRSVVPVDRFPVDESPYGVRGMGGNLIDWTKSLYQSDGPKIIDSRPQEVDSGTERVYRGGCWYFGERYLRSADRHSMSPEHRGNLIGFRIARSIVS